MHWRRGRDSNPRVVSHKLISRGVKRSKLPYISAQLLTTHLLKALIYKAFFISWYFAVFLFTKLFFTSGHHLGTTGTTQERRTE